MVTLSPLPASDIAPDSARSARQAAAWLEGSLGRELLRAETGLLAEVLDDVFGLELLQLGGWGPPRELLSGSRTRRQTIVAENLDEGADLIGRLTALPIAPASVDAVLLPHTLEFEPDPQAIVREADRVLTGEGQLIVIGFEPFSLWGLRASAARRGFPPGLKRMLPRHRVQDWLNLLGYEIVMNRHYLYSRPWNRGTDVPNARRILRRGLFNPLPAAAYLIKARKRIYTLTPIRNRFREQRQPVLGGLVKPTTRSRP
ncbi:MAG: methyltransferase domain-containing protein [Steroidobacteraceae bacterium]